MLRRKPKDQSTTRAKAAARVARLSTMDILNWADMAGSGVAQALNDYRRYQQADSLVEVRQGLEALLGCLDVLEARDQMSPVSR